MTELNIPKSLQPYLFFKEKEKFKKGDSYCIVGYSSIKMQSHTSIKWLHYVFKFDNNYGASVVKGRGTLGSVQDQWELATIYFDGNDYILTYDNPVCKDDVIGCLTSEEVIEALYKIKEFE